MAITDDPVMCDEIMKYMNEGLISRNEARKMLGLSANPKEIHPVWVRSCPNCGAPVKGEVCEYCDSVFSHTPVESIVKIQTEIDALAFSERMENIYGDSIRAIRRFP